MSSLSEPTMSLRERKKFKLRRTIQAEAMRLFAEQGYEQTTVEQIAAAAETSTTTFYRYFPTKEDTVLDDDIDPLSEATVAARPANETLTATIRAMTQADATAAEADRDNNIARLRLIAEVPALIARFSGEEFTTRLMFARVLGARTGRDTSDYQVTLTAAAIVAVIFTATTRWATENGAVSLNALLHEAVSTVEPLLAALGPIPQPNGDTR